MRLDSSGKRLDPPTRGFHIGTVWSADSLSDSVRLSFSDGLSGAEATLNIPSTPSDTLWGHIEEYWDFTATATDRGTIRAVRIDCPRDA